MSTEILSELLQPILLILSIDAICYIGLRRLVFLLGATRLPRWVTITFWSVPSVAMALLGARVLAGEEHGGPASTSLVVVLLVTYLPKLVFCLFVAADVAIRATVAGVAQLVPPDRAQKAALRAWARQFKALVGVGASLAVVAFLILLVGITAARNHATRIDVSVPVAGLPQELDGLTIVQVSDVHVAGLPASRLGVDRLVAMVNAVEADVVVLTGDVGTVADLASAPPFLNRLEARLGKLAVLGNHDLGDEERAEDNWVDDADKEIKIERLRATYGDAGFTLLINDAARMARDGATFAVLGVAPFDPHHGYRDADLSQCSRGLEDASLRILLTHNPELWFEAVVGATPIALTLAGHTHGGQVGLEAGPIRLSPAAHDGRHWAGLHVDGDQALYVSRGWGVYGLPFRMGIPAEVTVIRLLACPPRTDPNLLRVDLGRPVGWRTVCTRWTDPC